MQEEKFNKQGGNLDQPNVSGLAAKGAAVELFNMDCMELMAKYPDKHFDLAICDPPYGIGWSKSPASSSGIRTHSKNGTKGFVKGINHTPKEWDSIQPTQEYFNELFRVSKNQIIWGENYIQFEQKKLSTGRIFWDKVNGDTTFSDGELAWCSMNNTIKQIEYMWNGMMQGKGIFEGRVQQANKQLNEKKIHPTQKPIKLYQWILEYYAEKGMKILDTHLGNGSSAIAAYDLGYDFVGCEIDKEYFDVMQKRFKDVTAQTVLF